MWLSRTHSLKTECGNNAMWEYLKLANDEVARPGTKCRQCLLIYFSLVAVSCGLCDWFTREEASWWVCYSSWKLSGHLWTWELDHKESWALKNWCFWIVVLEKTLKSPLDCKEIQPVHSEGGQPWDFFGRNDVKAEAPVLWPPHAKSWLIGKDSDAGRDCGQDEKGTTEDEMAGWHHRLDGHESEWTPGVGDGQGGLASCDSWGHKESDKTGRLNWMRILLNYSIN